MYVFFTTTTLFNVFADLIFASAKTNYFVSHAHNSVIFKSFVLYILLSNVKFSQRINHSQSEIDKYVREIQHISKLLFVFTELFSNKQTAETDVNLLSSIEIINMMKIYY